MKNVLGDVLNPVARLQKKSNKATNTFTKTIDKLQKINGKLNSEVESRRSRIKELSSEKDQLMAARDSNVNVINKIRDILK